MALQSHVGDIIKQSCYQQDSKKCNVTGIGMHNLVDHIS